MTAPGVLVVTSSYTDATVATPVLAALEVAGVRVHAMDVGRGGDGSGAVDWLVRTLGGEMVERSLRKEVEQNRPDLVLSFDAGVSAALCELRDVVARPFVVIGVVTDLPPAAAWAQTACDRYFTSTDEGAALLEDHGVDGHRVVVMGPVGEHSFAAAGSVSSSRLRERFGLSGSVILVDVSQVEAEIASQLALQLSLIKRTVVVLFDAGNNLESAAALRSQVPLLDLKAKLFGESEDRALLWRCADVLVAGANSKNVSRSALLGAPIVCLTPREGSEVRRANALEDAGLGTVAGSALVVGSAVERALALSTGKSPGRDGAANIADAVWLLGQGREEVVAERDGIMRAQRRADVEEAARYAEWATGVGAAPSGLEDLSSPRTAGAPPPPPDTGKLKRLLKEIDAREEQLNRRAQDAQKQGAHWERQKAQGDKLENEDMSRHAERNADLERARMHQALSELAGLAEERAGLKAALEAAKRAPKVQTAAPREAANPKGGGTSVRSERSRSSVDEELERLRRQSGSTSPPNSRTRQTRKSGGSPREEANSVDEELAALKSKMGKKRK